MPKRKLNTTNDQGEPTTMLVETFDQDPFCEEPLEFGQTQYNCNNLGCKKFAYHHYTPDIPPGFWFKLADDSVFLACSKECAEAVDEDVPAGEWHRRPRDLRAALRRK